MERQEIPMAEVDGAMSWDWTLLPGEHGECTTSPRGCPSALPQILLGGA